jgi:hypothetical protein
MKGMLLLAAVLLVTVCFLLSCGKLDNKGTSPPNAPPVVYLANVPIDDSEWLRNPVIEWYATDRDGYVTKYRHIVMRCDDISHPDTFIAEAERNAFEGWDVTEVRAGEVSTSAPIWLYADPECDTCWVCDFFFIQAEDNFGAQSNVVYRRFYRGNHPPETYVSTPRGAQVTGSCCDQQLSTIGIVVSWEGADTLDYPGRQPDFYYSWEVFGPFTGSTDSLGIAYPDTEDVVWDQWVVDSSFNEQTGDRWTMDQSTVLYDLFRNVPSSGETVFGYFVFKVRTRDDAYVYDVSPAIGSFMAIQPECEYGIMLIDMTDYGTPGNGSLYGRAFNTPDSIVDTLYHQYFIDVVEEAYGAEIDAFYDADSAKGSPPPIDQYSSYKLIIILAEDAWNRTYIPWLNFMFTYMNLGGKVMLMGVDHFAWTKSASTFPYLDFSLNPLVTYYFDVRKQWVANWTGSYVRFITEPEVTRTNEEFIAGLSTVPDLPDVYPDSSRLAYYIAINHIIINGDDPYPYYQNSIPGVNFFVSGGRAERLYVAKSAYGKDGDIDGGPCGYRYADPCFKSAVFGFPLWPLYREDAVGLMKGMIDWFDIR